MPERKASHASPLDRDLIRDLSRVIGGQTVPQEVPEAAWPAISRLAVRHGLGPLLWWTLQESGMQVLDKRI